MYNVWDYKRRVRIELVSCTMNGPWSKFCYSAAMQEAVSTIVNAEQVS